ncbi:putative acyl-activating enzyme 19 isoform X3 [Cynara cardunculus var. scolymus]|uniref:putative acyl-activating enzyme 19 isoform X3 n=1 Tax=Cynara cardunculus var. scolymus TaxID=59895 RepID=UPI000D6255CE|nr:putative acyl-activating enzyme 19 isoform X3 [Cynara cardunculus var. scolymus]
MNQKNPSSLRSCCISHEFCKSASKNPNKIAVIHASPRHRGDRTKFATGIDQFIEASPSSDHPPVYEGDVCFTYSEILEAVDTLSRRLRFILDGGVDPSLIKPSPDLRHTDQSANTPRIVGIYMVPSVEYIISVLSVLRCGEAFMPLDPSWPKERVLSVVSSSTANLILCGSTSFDGNYSHYIDKYHWLVDGSGCPVLIISTKTNLKKHTASPCANMAYPCGNKKLRPFCYLMYTSGSTGKPKGVCGTEQGLLNRFMWMQDMYPLCENILSITKYLQDYSINRLVAVPSLMRMLFPTLQSSFSTKIQSSLKLLVLSGEILHLSLWNSLAKLLPNTAILNLYGSTEVSGDCTYFDCKRLSSLLEAEVLSTVPIGVPIPNCKVDLVGEDAPNYGEIYVSGFCIATGYFDHDIMPLNDVKVLPGSTFCCSADEKESLLYFKTGDFAKQLPGGDLIFLGRNDRTIKVNGQRIALEEIENTIRTHEDVGDAAVIFNNAEGEVAYLEAYIVTKQGLDCVRSLRYSLRGWMVDKLPLAMIPSRFFFIESIPMSSSGKVDYTLLPSSRCSMSEICSEINEIPDSNLLQMIKEAFCDALVVEKVSDDDDFFVMGGDSFSAAHTSHKLGINMKLLYAFPSPLKLVIALLDQGQQNHDRKRSVHSRVDMEVLGASRPLPILSEVSDLKTKKLHGRLSRKLGESDAEYYPSKVIRMDDDLNVDNIATGDGNTWDSISKHTSCAFSRCNKVMFGEKLDINRSFQATLFHETLGDKKTSMRELWKVHMESCVDASPLIVVREKDIYVYIGSHSQKFICMKAPSGFVQWQVQLEGRVESSAAILGDFSEVVVGCYKGNIYFLNSLNGSISWTFQTGGEVKSQPVVDKQRHLVWCGSYDHNLYALDYQSRCCVYKLHCGGSIYGSPAINEVNLVNHMLYQLVCSICKVVLHFFNLVDETLYLASTNGCMTALSLKDVPFSVLWLQDLGAPIFGSLSIDHINGNVICCLVNGHIVAVDATGSIVWRGITGGPIFAGSSLSHVLYNQVVACSRDGSVYSFNLEKGNLVWKCDLGDPISSSAYVDENLQLTSDHSLISDRLVCVCTSSGSIVVLRVNKEQNAVQKFGRIDVEGGIFSSPVMIGGRIFVGCRDDYVHCIGINGQLQFNQ